MSQEIKAIEFAIKIHGNQLYGNVPYIIHLAAVRKVLDDFGFAFDTDICVAAWLHDSIEDSENFDLTKNVIQFEFTDNVYSLVWAVTGVGENRKARNADAYQKMLLWPKSINLKLADRIANVEASKSNKSKLDMYRKEQNKFKDTFFQYGKTEMWDRLNAGF